MGGLRRGEVDVRLSDCCFRLERGDEWIVGEVFFMELVIKIKLYCNINESDCWA